MQGLASECLSPTISLHTEESKDGGQLVVPPMQHPFPPFLPLSLYTYISYICIILNIYKYIVCKYIYMYLYRHIQIYLIYILNQHAIHKTYVCIYLDKEQRKRSLEQ